MDQQENLGPAALVELSKRVAAKVEILQIRLVQSTVKAELERPEPPEHVRHGLQVNCVADRETKTITVRVKFLFRAHYEDGKEPSTAPLIVDAEFMLAYQVPSLDGIEEKHIDAFAKLNGAYNAWPYWREYLQSSLTRVGLPALTVPVATIPLLMAIYSHSGMRQETWEGGKEQAAPETK